MIVYWILLLPTAFIAYCAGSISTLSIASVFVFHRDLHHIGKKRMFVSNFRRLYGYKGFLKLILVELLRDFVPVLLGGLLLGFKGHADIGRAFAGFCLTTASSRSALRCMTTCAGSRGFTASSLAPS